MNSSTFGTVLLIFTSYYVGNCGNIDIVRAEQDRFTNIAYDCSLVANAGCFDTYCTYCQCGVNQTFVQTRGLFGECVANDLLVYATAREASFFIQNNRNKLCPYQSLLVKHTRFVVASSYCQTDDWSSRWLWTNDDQLVDMATLECITDDYATTSEHFLTIRKCDRYNQKQSWRCVGDKKYEILGTMSGRYMHFGDYTWYVTTKTTDPHFVQKWKRYNTGKDICSQAVGCDVFADGSSLLILNRTKCKQRSECLGQKQIDLSKSSCVLSENKTQYLHHDTWKPLEIANGIGSFVVSTLDYKIFLKWDLSETPKSWAGLLVKAHFECEDMAQTIKTEHCVVIKYKGTFIDFQKKYPYQEMFTPGIDNKNKSKNPENWDKIKNKTKETDLNDDHSSAGGKDGTLTIIIIVSALASLCIATIMMITVYKCRKRIVHQKNANTENPDQNVSPILEVRSEYEDTLNDNQPAPRESQLNIASCKEHEYQYIYVNDSKSIVKPNNQQSCDETKGHDSYEDVSTDRPLENNRQTSVEPRRNDSYEYVSVNRSGENNQQKSEEANGMDSNEDVSTDRLLDNNKQTSEEPKKDDSYEYVSVNRSGKNNQQKSEEANGMDSNEDVSTDRLLDNNKQASEEPKRDDSYEHVSVNRSGENNQQRSEEANRMDSNEDVSTGRLQDNNKQTSEEPKRDDSYEHVSVKSPLANNQPISEVPLLYVTVTDAIQV